MNEIHVNDKPIIKNNLNNYMVGKHDKVKYIATGNNINEITVELVFKCPQLNKCNYCLRCKNKTDTKNINKSTSKNGIPVMKCIRIQCDSKISMMWAWLGKRHVNAMSARQERDSKIRFGSRW